MLFNRKKSILIVDDSELDLILVEHMLDDKYEIFSTQSGKEALDFLLNVNTPDLILLDLIMPEMDGWETFSRIKALSSISHIPIAFITSETGEAEQDRAREMGAVDFIFKPYERYELHERVKAIFKKYPVKAENRGTRKEDPQL